MTPRRSPRTFLRLCAAVALVAGAFALAALARDGGPAKAASQVHREAAAEFTRAQHGGEVLRRLGFAHGDADYPSRTAAAVRRAANARTREGRELAPSPADLRLRRPSQERLAAAFGVQCLPGTFTNTSPPQVSVASAYVGTDITTTNGTWTGCGTWSYRYKWQRNGVDIAGATSWTYRVQTADVNATLRSAVEAWNADGSSGYVVSSNATSIPNRAPAWPSGQFPPGGTVSTNRSPTLSATYTDPDGQAGRIDFYVYRSDGTFITSGASATVASGQAAAWTVNTTLAGDTSFNWYAEAVDSSGGRSGWPPANSYYVNIPPTVPALTEPSDGARLSTITPTLAITASTDGEGITYDYQVATDAAFSDIRAESGWISSTSWSPPSGLADGSTHYWRVQAKDFYGAASAWSAARRFEVPKPGLRREFTYETFAINDREGLSVNVASGNLILQANDLSLPGINAFTFAFSRYYNGVNAGRSTLAPLANGWETVPQISVYANGDVLHQGSTGIEAVYRKNGDGSFVTPPGGDATLVKEPDGTYTLTFHQDGDKQRFTSTGLLSAYVDRNGNTITFARTSGQITRVTDTFGRDTTFSYTGSNLTTINDPAGRSYRYGYDGTGNLTTYTDPANNVTTYAYTGSLLTQVTDPLGQATKINYDSANRVASVTRGLNAAGSCPMGATCPTTSFSYLVPGGTFCTKPTTDVTDPNSHVSRYCYDGRLRVTKVRDPLGNTASTDYTTANGGAACTDSTGKTRDDLPCSSTNATGDTTTFAYDTASTKPENALWSQSPLETPASRPTVAYDAAHPFDISTFTDARGKVTTYSYGPAGNVTRVVPDGRTQAEFTYNSRGQVVTAIDGNGKTTTCAYDATGNLVSKTVPLGNRTTYTYDAIGRLLTRVDPLGNVAGGNPAAHTTSYMYDAFDRLLSETDPLGHVKAYEYDANGNKTRVTDANGHTTISSYDALNRVVTVTRPDPDGAGPLTGPVTSYAYDASGNRVREVAPRGNLPGADPAAFTTTSVYDAADRLTSVTTPLGGKTTYDYDANGRLTSVVEPRGNVAGANPADYRSTKTYDAVGQLRTETDPLGNTTSHEYDLVGNEARTTDANGHTTTSTYDAAGRVLTVTAPDGGVTAHTYDGDGNELTRSDPNGHTTTYAYDDGGHLVLVTAPDPDGAGPLTAAMTSYAYDANGNRTATITPNGNGTPVVGDGTIAYSYDAANRLTATNYSDSTPDVSIAYDAVGNRTSMTDGAGAAIYDYDGLDRLRSVTRGTDSFAYAYDVAGNITSRTYPGNTVSSYSYDAEDRLTQATTAGAVTSYAYDPAGRLTQTTLPASNGYVETRTFDRAGRLIEVKNATPTTFSWAAETGAIRGGGSATLSGNEITDSTRATGREGDGRVAPDSSMGIWAATTNLVPNGGFESDTNGYQKIELGSAANSVTATRPTERAKFGSASLKLVQTTAGEDDFMRLQLGVSANTKYTASGWVDASLMQGAAALNRGLMVVDVANGYVERGTATVSGPTSGFVRLAVTFTTGATAGLLEIRLYAPKGTIYWDGIQIERQPVATPYVETNGASATRGVGRIQVPAARLSATQGWFAARLRPEWAASADVTEVGGDPRVFHWGNGNDALSLQYRTGTDAWFARRLVGGSGGSVESSRQTFAAGTTVTVVFAWTANSVKLSVNGGAFTSVANTTIPSLSNSMIDIGNRFDLARAFDGEILWIAAGTGVVNNADAANIDAFGNSDPALEQLPGFLSDFAYSLDPVGNPTTITRAGTASSTTTYTYDVNDRLTSVCFQSSCPGASDPFIRWSFDRVGNRLTEARPSGTTAYTYDAADRLTQAGTTTYTYDTNGNVTRAGARTFDYDLENRLISTAASSTTTAYTYDGDGNQVSATTGQQTTRSLWDVNAASPRLALRRDGGGALINRFSYGRQRISISAGGAVSYYHYDRNGSVVNTTSSPGGLEWTYAYEPFGALRTETRADTGVQPNPFKFTAGLFDEATGLYHLGAREYDPASGRFFASDPLPSDGSVYAYAGNRPTVLIDPSGLRPIDPGDEDARLTRPPTTPALPPPPVLPPGGASDPPASTPSPAVDSPTRCPIQCRGSSVPRWTRSLRHVYFPRGSAEAAWANEPGIANVKARDPDEYRLWATRIVQRGRLFVGWYKGLSILGYFGGLRHPSDPDYAMAVFANRWLEHPLLSRRFIGAHFCRYGDDRCQKYRHLSDEFEDQWGPSA